MDTEKVYDIMGIGIGPFNLGLAALTANMPGLDCVFIDRNDCFQWHPGLLLPNAKMQVPFYADLVTLADPTSPFTFMNYLKQTNKLFRFAINESHFPYRIEYNQYCQWVTQQLSSLHFGYDGKAVKYDPRQLCYLVCVVQEQTGKLTLLKARHLVVGIGSVPHVPECIAALEPHPAIFHASEYLQHKHVALMHKKITIIGSGQSAAEIFQDLLPQVNNLDALHWYSRSSRIFPMDYSKFSLEMSSPEYIQYFYHLPKHRKRSILGQQHDLYKGINFSLIEAIYEQLYQLSLNANNRMPVIRTNCALIKAQQAGHKEVTMTIEQRQTDKIWEEQTNILILATGYQPTNPAVLAGVPHIVKKDHQGKYEVREDYSIDDHHTLFVQNADWHTHGFNSADLGLGPYRNMKILNSILKADHFDCPTDSVFQSF